MVKCSSATQMAKFLGFCQVDFEVPKNAATILLTVTHLILGIGLILVLFVWWRL